MDARDVALLAVTGYVAVMALVRLMAARHRALLDELRRHVKPARRQNPSAKDRASKAA